MIAKHSVDFDHIHVANAGRIENLLRRLRSGHVTGGPNLAVLGKCRFHPVLSPKSQKQWNDDEPKKIHWFSKSERRCLLE